MNKVEINITTWSILKVLLIGIGLWFLFSIKQILAIIFFALILSSAIDDGIDKLVSKKVPRVLSVILIFVIILSIVAIIIISIAEPLSRQGQELIKHYPEYNTAVIESLKSLVGEQTFSTSLTQNQFISSKLTTQNIFSTLSSIFGGVTSFVLVLVLTFYMSIETQALKKAITFVTPTNYHQFTNNLVTKIQNKIGDWIQAQLFLSFIVTLIVYIGLSLLGVKYALLLALLAGLGEFIPYVGPSIAAILAIFIAFTTAPLQALFVGIFYAILQVIENHILVPKIMQKAVGLNPIIIICALLIGIKLGGVIGGLLAIPTTTALSVVIDEFQKNKKLFNTNN